jgi:four helix bundle protein
MKDYKHLFVWKKGLEIVKQTYLVAGELPSSEKFNLVSQMTRAAVSIPSNIAEGSSRNSERDYYRFLEIALGSCFELETQALILKELNIGVIPVIDILLKIIEEEIMMLYGFMKKLDK